MDKLIITAALTGAEVTRAANPNLPVTPQEIAWSAYQCYLAGASIVHVHVRRDDGTPTQDAAIFKEVIDLIRDRCDIIILVSTGGAVWMTPQERLQPVFLKPNLPMFSVQVCLPYSRVFLELVLSPLFTS